MSDIDDDLRTLLLAQADISAAAVGGVHIDEAPQGTALPYVVITEMDVEGNTTLDGDTDDLQFVTYDLDCYGQTQKKAKNLRTLIRSFLADFTGPTGGTETIAAVVVNGSASDRIPPTDGKGPSTYVRTLDLTVQYNPA